MNKRLFLVICVNEKRKIIEKKAFEEYVDAFNYMQASFERENESEDKSFNGLFAVSAFSTNNDETIGYWWNIEIMDISINF